MYTTELESLCNSLASQLDNETKIYATESEDSYAVTKHTEFPALLVEMGYATNANDAEKLNSASWRWNFCELLSQEIMTLNNAS